MTSIVYARHRFPPDIIFHAVWLYLRFSPSHRDVKEFLASRGLNVSYETVRRWVMKFGLQFACNLRASRPRQGDRCLLDEMVASIGGKRQQQCCGRCEAWKHHASRSSTRR